LKEGMTKRFFLIILSLYSGFIFAQEKETYNDLFFQTEAQLRSHFVGFPIQKKISVTGGLSPYIYQIQDSHLPEGIKLTEDGFLSGIAQKISSATFSVRVNDHKGQTVQKEFTIDFVEQLMMKTEALDNAIAGTMYNQQIFATGGSKGDYKWEIVSNNTPEGMQLDSQSGIFSGIPQKSGKYMITVVVQDTDAHTSTKRFPFRIIEPLQIKSLVMPSGLVGEEYSELIQISGGVGPYTFSCSDNLPEGLTLDPVTGIIEGIPSYCEYVEILVNVQDNYLVTPQHVEEKVRVVINKEFRFTTNSVLPDALQNKPLWKIGDFGISLSGGIGPFTFEIIDGALPPGIDFNVGQGVELIRTPITSGTYKFTLEATDSVGGITNKTFIWHIYEDFWFTTNSILPDAFQHVPLSEVDDFIISVDGGITPFTFEIIDGALPPGIDINVGQGVELIRTPITSGIYQFTLEATDSVGRIINKTFIWHIIPEMKIVTKAIPNAFMNVPYQQELVAEFGTPPYIWEIYDGQLPDGLSLKQENDIWFIDGIPRKRVNYMEFTFKVSDSNPVEPFIKYITLSLSIISNDLIITTSSLPAGKVGAAYLCQINAALGKEPYKWTLTSGSLPYGLSWTVRNQDVCILGRPKVSGNYPISFMVADDDEYSTPVSKSFNIKIHDIITIVAESFVETSRFTFYSQALEILNKDDTVFCNLTYGHLPKGLELNSQTCTISGTPTEDAHSESFCIKAIKPGKFGSLDERCFAIIIQEDPNLIIKTGFMKKGYQFEEYFHSLEARGGTKIYHWFISGGYLPKGIDYYQERDALYFEGIPEQCGLFEFDIKIIDSSFVRSSRMKDYQLRIYCADEESADIIRPEPPNMKISFPETDQWSNGIITVQLIPGTDADSGVSGYSYEWNHNKTTDVDNTVETTDTIITSDLLRYGENIYLHVATVDNVGNKSDTVHFGPFKVSQPHGHILIVGGGESSDPFWNITKVLTVNAYRNFRAMGYQDYQIDFHIQSQMISIDFDEVPDDIIDDSTPTVNEIGNAIRAGESKVDEYNRYILYLQGYGTNDARLRVGGMDDYITAQEIDVALDWLQTRTNCEVIVIVESCFSGTFIEPLAGENRVIITSADNQRYNTDSQGHIAFSRYMFAKLREPNKTLREAFSFAHMCMKNIGFPEPKMDDTGDGIVNELDGLPDGKADKIVLDYNGSFAKKPEFKNITVTQNDQTSYQANVLLYESDLKITDVFAQIIPPNNDILNDCGIIYLEHVPLHTTSEQEFENIITDIAQSGEYKIVFNATNRLGENSDPQIYTINSGLRSSTGSFLSDTIQDLYISYDAMIQGQSLKKQTINKTTEQINEMIADNHKIYGKISQCGSNTLITNVSISTENGDIHTATNCQGEFEIRNLNPGKYDLIFSKNNFLKKNVSVDVNSNHDYYIDVCMCPDIDINFSTDTLLPSAIIGKQYWNSIDVNGGCQPYTFSYEGNLPNGLLLAQDTGSIFGMINPLEDSDMYSFTVTVRDQNDMIKKKQYSINTYHEFKLSSSPFICLTVGAPFRKTTSVNGGKRPYFFEIYSGTLPEGVILTETGLMEGIPEKMGSTCITVQVIDDEGRTIKENLILEIVDEIQIKTDRLHHAVVDYTYNMKLEASGGAYGKYQWEIVSEDIPRNMILDKKSGVLSGVPKEKEKLPVTFKVVDSCGHSAKKTFVFDSVEPLQIRSHTLGPGLIYHEFHESILVTGGIKPYTFTLSDNLPTGLSFDPVSGMIDGIPIDTVKIQLNVSVKDCCYPNPQIDEEEIILIIDEQFIFETLNVLPDAYCNMPLSETGIDYYITVKGGLSPYTFHIVEGALPFGVKITKLFFGIELSRSPMSCGSHMFTLQATDATGDTIQKNFFWYIIPELSILTNSLSNAVLYEPYQEILLTESGVPPYYWDIIKGTLPKGLKLEQENEVWCIIGTPLEQPDDCEITFQVTDSSQISWKKEVTLCLKIMGNDEKRSFSMHQPYEISDEIFTDNQHNKSEPFLNKLFFLSPSFLKSIVIETSYQKEIIVSGGKAPYTFTLLNGNLPSGITLMDNGRLEGIPDKIGKASFVIKVTDTEGQTTEQNFSIEVVDRLSITNEKLPNALVGYFFKTRLNVSGGLKSQYLWDITSNILPKGMILDKFSGDFYGIPKEAEKCVINVRVRDSDGHHAEKNFLFHTVDQLKIIRPVLQTGHLGFDYNENIRVSGGVPPYTFQCPEYLPKNLAIDPSTGIIHGKALEPGRMDIKLMVKDSFFPISQHLEDIITITINEGFLITTNNVLPSAIQNEPLNNNGHYTIQLVGGAAPYTFTIIDGTLPTGVHLINTEKTVKLSQTPKEAGNFQFTLQVTDSNDEICQKEFFWHILEQMNISEQQSLYATLNESFYHNLEILGGISPFTCTIQSGKLPKGLALIKQNDFWGISGIPTELTRNAQISIIVKDSQSIPANIEINRSINVVENKLLLQPESLPDAKIGKSYKVKIFALSGQQPYKWNIHENQLPDGLSCFFKDESLWIQGKPNVSGTFPVNIELIDSNIYGEPISRSLTIVVHDEISIQTEKLPRAVYGEFYSQTIEINNDNDTVSCQLIDGDLPGGLEFNSNTCTISGMINKNSTSQSFCVRASSQSGFISYDEKCFSIISNIADLKIITSFMRPNEQHSQYFDFLNSSGGIKPYFWFINKKFLPNGMNYYQENNTLYFEGAPTQCGKFEFIVHVHDASQITEYDSKQYSLEILCLDPGDITPPTPPQVSMTFPGLEYWSNGIITVLLLPGEDNDSGIAGYSYEWNREKTTFVDNTIETSDLQIASPLLLNGENFYVHIASVDNAGNESETIHYGPFKVNHPGGYILIVGGGDRINPYWNIAKQLTIYVYREFRAMGYQDEQIVYHIQSDKISIDYDDIPDDVVDDSTPTASEITDAIREAEKFVDENNPFIFYIHAPGRDDSRLELTGIDHFISAYEIDDALDWLQTKTNCEVFVIIDSCFSGNFIKGLSGDHRIILASAGDERYNSDSQGQLLFSKYLFLKLKQGKTLKESFDFARLCTLNTGYPEPQLDDTGDGIYDHHDALENGYADRIILNSNGHWCGPPMIKKLIVEALPKNHYQIEASLYRSGILIKEVFVQVIPPVNDIYKGCSTINFPRHILTQTDTEEEDTYQTSLYNLNQTGTYKLIFHAIDRLEELSDPLIYPLTVFKPGDINGDNLVNLQDAIVALKAASKLITLNESTQESGNIESYRKIGLVDVMFILNELSQL
jgi:hypothetical protein